MSATSHSGELEGREYDCEYCGEATDAARMVRGSFCSVECYHAHKRMKRAREILRELEQDHRWCATCGRQLKEIEEPTESYEVVVGPCDHFDDWQNVTDVLIGYQYRTKHAETGEISLDVDDEHHGDHPIVEDGVATGTVCTCGNTSHRHEEEIIRNRLPFTTAHWLFIAARELREEEKHDVELDREQLFDAVLERQSMREALASAVVLDA